MCGASKMKRPAADSASPKGRAKSRKHLEDEPQDMEKATESTPADPEKSEAGGKEDKRNSEAKDDLASQISKSESLNQKLALVKGSTSLTPKEKLDLLNSTLTTAEWNS